MYNYFMLVGRVAEDFEVKTLSHDRKEALINLSVGRDFKDMNGEYIYDIIPVVAYDFLAGLAADTLRNGSKVGVKGSIRIEKGKTLLVAERIIYFE